MKRMKVWSRGCVAVMGLWAVLPAVATVYPPGGYADPAWAPQWFIDCDQYKSWADWEFNVQAGPGAQVAPDNEGWNWDFDQQDPRVQPRITLTGNAAWVQEHQGRQGVVGGESPVDFHIWMDNEEQPNWTKQVLLRFDLWTTLSGFADFGPEDIQLEYPGAGIPAAPLRLDEVILAGGWRQVELYFEIPQPNWEQVNINFSPLTFQDTLYIDDVKMLTQCVPEPATLALAGAALAWLWISQRQSEV